MRRNEAFPSSTLSRDDVPAPIIAIIDQVTSHTFRNDDGKEESKPLMSFSHPHGLKNMAINNTNWDTLEEAFGPESDDWRGKRVEIYFEPNVKFGTKKVGGLRLRILGAAPAYTGSLNGNGNGGPAVWGILQAAAECEKVGISKVELGDYLRSNGFVPYNGERHTALVQALIKSRSVPAARAIGDESLDSLNPPPPGKSDEEIPFAFWWVAPLLMATLTAVGLA